MSTAKEFSNDKPDDKTETNPITEQFGGVLTTLTSFRSQITMLQNQKPFYYLLIYITLKSRLKMNASLKRLIF